MAHDNPLEGDGVEPLCDAALPLTETEEAVREAPQEETQEGAKSVKEPPGEPVQGNEVVAGGDEADICQRRRRTRR